jgi:hypothetical protein
MAGQPTPCLSGLPSRRKQVARALATMGHVRHTQRVTTALPGTRAEDGLVQLNYVEVDPAALSAPGARLDALLASRVIDNLPETWPEEFPADGWRLIYPRRAPGRASPKLAEVLAAPLPACDGAFAMVSLTERDGKLRLGCDPGPVAVNPGRATRRHGLQLQWRTPVLRAHAGQPLKLTIELVNSSWRRWHNVADDSGVVVGWLLDAEKTGSETESRPAPGARAWPVCMPPDGSPGPLPASRRPERP